MGPYGTAEVEALLGVGEHVLRYWERRLPLLSPARSAFGRRAWTEADLALLLRVRHLVRDRGLGLDRALSELIAERSGSGAAVAAALAEARARLVRAYFDNRRRRAILDRAFPAVRADEPGP